jgi:hypothetical protein
MNRFVVSGLHEVCVFLEFRLCINVVFMVFSQNTLEFWHFKGKKWILFLCKACALVVGLKENVGQVGFSLWFSVENMIMVQQALIFYLHGVLPPVWVLVVVTHFSSRSWL